MKYPRYEKNGDEDLMRDLKKIDNIKGLYKRSESQAGLISFSSKVHIDKLNP